MNHKRLRLALRFYKETLMVPGIIISGLFGKIFAFAEGANPIQLFLLRTVPIANILCFIAISRKRELAYYRNLGLPRLTLLGLSALYDFVAAIIIIIPFYVAR